MNNYITFELSDLANKMKGYNMLFNYRMTNLCVKAEPTALMPVTVLVADSEYNLEEVANIMRPDDFSFDPEFKMEMKTDKPEHEGGEEKQHILYTMPPVDKDRRNLLNDTTKLFHKECLANLDVTYAELQARLVEPYTKMSPLDVDEARKAFKKVYDTSKDQCDKMLEQKLNEIEEGYQRYLLGDNDQINAPDAGDDDMELSHDAEVEALFN